MTASRIIVGVNGSAASTAAVRWAALEAQFRGVGLHVVVAHRRRIPGWGIVSRRELALNRNELVTGILDAAVAQVRSSATGVRVWGEAIVGDPVPVLLTAATDADLLVVGGRDRGNLGPMLGAVTSQVAAYAPSPVAVVRPGHRNSGDGNTIVLGIDDSPDATLTAGLAFEEAALRRSSTLLAVTACNLPPGPDRDTTETVLRRRLADWLAPWRDKYPETPVTCEVVHGDAGAVLAEKSQRAGLLVVGAGSRRDFEALRLGPVRLHLLHHANCPMLIARATGG